MTTIVTIEEHDQQSRMDLAKHALMVLNKAYPNYNWGVSCLGKTTIRITEQKFLEWGGDQQCMSVHDTDWGTLLQFEDIVKKYGGEFLERGNLSRTRNNAPRIDKLPDGFNARFARNHTTKRIKMVGPNGESIEQLKAKAAAAYAKQGLILP